MSSDGDESSFLLDELDDFIHVSASGYVVLYSTEHVLVVNRPWVQIVKGLQLISMLEEVHAFLSTMVFENDEFLALVFGKFALQL